MGHTSSRVDTTIHRQYRMIHNIFVLLDDGDRHVLEPFGLTFPQFRVLQSLDPDEGQRLTTLSERLLRAKSTITRIIDQLERDGLVERTSDSEDRRAQRVVLTPDGAAVLEQASIAHDRMLACRFNTALNAAEQADFLRLLTQLHDSLVGTMESRSVQDDRVSRF